MSGYRGFRHEMTSQENVRFVVAVKDYGNLVVVLGVDEDGGDLTAHEAREIAGALVQAANEVEGGAA